MEFVVDFGNGMWGHFSDIVGRNKGEMKLTITDDKDEKLSKTFFVKREDIKRLGKVC